MNKLKITLFIIILSLNCFAQKQGNIWYFGDGIGLDFNQNPPALLTNGKMITNEGCSSIADENGQLLLYTDGIKTIKLSQMQMIYMGIFLLLNQELLLRNQHLILFIMYLQLMQ